MSIPTTTSRLQQQLFNAIFVPNGAPDVAEIKRIIATNEIHGKPLEIGLAVLRGYERQLRKQKRTARYLRHYRRIARSLQ